MKRPFPLLACLALLLSLSSYADNIYHECQQICGYTPHGPTLTFSSNDELEARQLVIDSCRNMGRTLQGEMRCQQTDAGGAHSEPYAECMHGTIDGNTFVCRTYGVAYILEPGKETISAELRWNNSRCSFAESDRRLQANCDHLAAYYPHADIRCVTRFRVPEYSPYSSPVCP